MKRIGIIGENYNNDACALANFLTPQYKGKIVFIPILKSLKGGINSAEKIARMLPTEMSKNKLDAVICSHDLDDWAKLANWQKWFDILNKSINNGGVFLLLVMELEALILADIKVLKKIYDVDIQYKGNPLTEKDPKKWLKEKTAKAKKKYDENQAEEILKNLDFAEVCRNHNGKYSFQDFIQDFEKRFGI